MTKPIAMSAALLAAMCWTIGCGDDTGDEHGDHGDSGDHSDHLEVVPCPPETPAFVATPSEGLEAEGEQGHVTAKLIDAEWSPPRKTTNDWTVLFQDADGMALDDIEIKMAQPYMPAHRHDGRYPPTLTPLDDAGMVQVDDINLWMGGPWEMRFWVESESAGTDYIVFNVCVED